MLNKEWVLMKVLLHLADGFEEIEALSTLDILRRADIDTTTVSIMGRIEVKSSRGVIIQADKVFSDINYQEFDMIILPGGPGTTLLDQHEELKSHLKNYDAEGKWIAALCAAPSVLGKLNLLNGKNAVCYPGYENDLLGAKVSLNEKVVVDGNIITSRGPGTSFDFAFKIVEVLKGSVLVDELKVRRNRKIISNNIK